ncbi:MAG: thermonuclease family protein [Anaerolineales bacterium]
MNSNWQNTIIEKKNILIPVGVGVLMCMCGLIVGYALASSGSADLAPGEVTQTIAAALVERPTYTPYPTNTPYNTPAAVVMVVTPTAGITPLPSPTSTPDQTALDAKCIPQNTERQDAQLNKVVSGDTIDVLIDGNLFTVRYVGIDALGSSDYIASTSRNKNYELVINKDLTLVKDASDTGPGGQLLRYVLADGEFVNLDLANMGYASAASSPPDTACDAAFKAAEEDAKTNLSGIWAFDTSAEPAAQDAAPSGSAQVTAKPASCDSSYPDVCIPPPPPDLDCIHVPYRNFKVIPPDTHGLDSDGNGIGCDE